MESTLLALSSAHSRGIVRRHCRWLACECEGDSERNLNGTRSEKQSVVGLVFRVPCNFFWFLFSTDCVFVAEIKLKDIVGTLQADRNVDLHAGGCCPHQLWLMDRDLW